MARSEEPAETGRTIPTGWSDAGPGGGTAAPGDHRRASDGPPGDGATLADGPDPALARRPRPLLVAGVITSVLALVLLLPPLLLGGATARETVEDYLAAVVAGDAEVVREHLAVQEGVLDIAVSDPVIASTGDRIQRFSIDQVSVDGDRAEVVATVYGDDDALTTVLRLRRHRSGPLRDQVWHLQPLRLPVLRVEVPVGTETLEINGHTLVIPPEQRPRESFGLGELLLYVVPGTIEVRAPEIGDHLAPVPVRVNFPHLFGDWTSHRVAAGYEPTAEGTRQITEMLTGSLEQCLRSTAARPEGCPLSAPAEVRGPGSWELLRGPTVSDVWPRGQSIEVTVTAAAVYTVEEAGDPEIHHVDMEARAEVVLDRDGRFHVAWFLDPIDDDVPER